MALARPLAAILVLLALAGCALSKPTPYAPVTANSDYGYRDTKIDDRTWRVSVNGNVETPRELVENQLLYRAAEIAKANGATGYVVLDRDTEQKSRVLGAGGYWDPFFAYPYGPFWAGYAFGPGYRPYYGPWGPAWGLGFGMGWGGGFGGWSAGVGRTWGYGPYYGSRVITKYAAYAEIQLFDGDPPEGLGPSFNAEQVLANLADKVNKQPAQPAN